MRYDSPSYKAFRVLNTVVLLGVIFVTLFPFLNVVAKSFSSEAAISTGQVGLWPVGFNTTTYRLVLADTAFWTGYKNTILYTVVATAIALVFTTAFAYVLSKQNLRGRPLLIGFAVFTMFFNGGLIPNYILITNLGLKNTIWAVVLPNAISVFNLLVMKAFFEGLPHELEEAAELDGLGTYGILFRIVLPLSKAIIATMFLFYAVSNWNAWFGAFLYFDDSSMFPVTIYLRNMLAGATGTEAVGGGGADTAQVASNLKAVTMVLTALPILCVYPFVQRYFVTGVTLGSVKG
ncbi:carbohydrate ABC transporter permease [Actinomyces sp. 186855]|nr:carbohydrate ABC transporter permease [Actinomyces sp. AC-20-1]MCL3789011.1 carbohydrate ABC transporter permease [Actinomyces sp. 187325]MCL3791366.1 carbohydrate ABC transporter permease [Actinomyces sp. 186855]MCL3793923.1 carbohydrate ABC transporter permease [Actinomyces sp. 217892]